MSKRIPLTRHSIDCATPTFIPFDVPRTEEDRESARSILWRLPELGTAYVSFNGPTAEYFEMLHTVELLMEIASPLPRGLENRLLPWMTALRARRQRLVDRNRRLESQLTPRWFEIERKASLARSGDENADASAPRASARQKT